MLGLLRYDLSAAAASDRADELLGPFAYEGQRLFRDRLVGRDNCDKFDTTLISVLRNDWSVSLDKLNSSYFVTWGSAAANVAVGQTELKNVFGKPIGPLNEEDFKQIIAKGLHSYGM